LSTPTQSWIANARMYSVSAAAGEAWRALFSQLARRARLPIQVIDHPAPAPLSELWARSDRGAVFMCGLPFSRAEPRPQLIAAPVPLAVEFRGQPLYWSEFVVRADSAHHALSDTFGGRIAFTTPESQSGFAAPLQHLSAAGDGGALFREVIAPQITPQGALTAVAEDRADIAAIDAYSLQLLRRFAPELAARIRVVARTEPRPIPPLVASRAFEPLTQAFLAAHQDVALHPILADLRLSRFVQANPDTYRRLATEFEDTLAHWRAHKLALELHPAFAVLNAAPGTRGADAT
jgi:ABC-type phosphate/phosphonate transport system substrate-binding protein